MGKGQLLTWLWVRALCYLHLIKICLQLRLLLEEESLLLESVFLQLLFKAPWWFFTIERTGVLGFGQKAGLLEEQTNNINMMLCCHQECSHQTVSLPGGKSRVCPPESLQGEVTDTCSLRPW